MCHRNKLWLDLSLKMKVGNIRKGAWGLYLFTTVKLQSHWWMIEGWWIECKWVLPLEPIRSLSPSAIYFPEQYVETMLLIYILSVSSHSSPFPSPPSVSGSQNLTTQQTFVQMCVCVCVCVCPLTPQLSAQPCSLSVCTCVTVCLCVSVSVSQCPVERKHNGDQRWE